MIKKRERREVKISKSCVTFHTCSGTVAQINLVFLSDNTWLTANKQWRFSEKSFIIVLLYYVLSATTYLQAQVVDCLRLWGTYSEEDNHLRLQREVLKRFVSFTMYGVRDLGRYIVFDEPKLKHE